MNENETDEQREYELINHIKLYQAIITDILTTELDKALATYEDDNSTRTIY